MAITQKSPLKSNLPKYILAMLEQPAVIETIQLVELPKPKRIGTGKPMGRKPKSLSDIDVRAIRESGETGRALALRYGVSSQYISNIRKGTRRTDVT